MSLYRSILEPYKIIYERSKDESRVGFVTLEPCQKGFGTLIANSLRRAMFAGIDGFAVSCIKIHGVEHEFSGINGVIEDALDVVSNVKLLRFESTSSMRPSYFVASISFDGPGLITGADINLPDGVKCLNPEVEICTVSDKVKIEMSMLVRSGIGYSENESNFEMDSRILGSPVSCISVSSNYCPIESVSFEVQNTHYGDIQDCEKVVMKVVTDGSISPDAAVKKASALLSRQFSRLAGDVESLVNEPRAELKEVLDSVDPAEQMCEKLMKNIEDLELTVRSSNCLTSAGITTVWALVQMHQNDLLKLANFGRKSLNEISDILGKLGFSLGMDIPDNVFKLMSDKISSITGASNSDSMQS